MNREREEWGEGICEGIASIAFVLNGARGGEDMRERTT